MPAKPQAKRGHGGGLHGHHRHCEVLQLLSVHVVVLIIEEAIVIAVEVVFIAVIFLIGVVVKFGTAYQSVSLSEDLALRDDGAQLRFNVPPD